MSLPSPQKIDASVAVISAAASTELSQLLGEVPVDQSMLQALFQAAVDAICMRAWRAAQAAGQAAADSITTEAQAEASLRSK